MEICKAFVTKDNGYGDCGEPAFIHRDINTERCLKHWISFQYGSKKGRLYLHWFVTSGCVDRKLQAAIAEYLLAKLEKLENDCCYRHDSCRHV